MKKRTIAFITLLVFCMSMSSVFAFGLPNIPGIGGGSSNSPSAVDIAGSTAAAKRIIGKYTLSTIAFLSARGEIEEAVGLKEDASKTLAIRDKLEQSPTLENHQQANALMVDKKQQSKLEEMINAAELTNEQATQIVGNSSLKVNAANILNATIALDAISLVKELGQGLSGLTKDPLKNGNAIKQVKSFIDVINFMNKVIPTQKVAHDSYNKIRDQIAQKYNVEKPSDEAVQEAANQLNTKE